MDFLKPPTDNLYKFLAIAGLVLIGLAVYSYSNARNQELRAMQDVQNALIPVFDVKEEKLQYGPPFRLTRTKEPRDFGSISGSKQEYDGYCKNFYQVIDNYWNGIEAATKDEMVEYFKRPVVVQFYQREKKMTPESYKEMVDKITLPEFWEQTAFEREVARLNLQHYSKILSLSHIARKTHLESEQISFWSNVGLWFGIAFTILGFGCWMVLVQRHQDAILKHEREYARKKSLAKIP
jgi:hypothetical protein